MRLSSSRSTAIIHRPQQDFPLWDKAGTRPSLDLQFADRKDLVDATTGSNLVDHTRASAGTYVGSDGLIKTAVTNLLLQSEDFSTTWSFDDTTVDTNAILSPAGTLTADKIVSTAVSSTHHRQQPFTSSDAPYTLSVFAKAAEYKFLELWANPTSGVRAARCNLLTGAISASGSGATAIATPLPNGWYRVSMTFPALGANTVRLYVLDDSENVSYTGDGTSGFYLWGAQLEQSSTVGEYVPTTSTINSAPRFDHDPTTGESLGLLVEEQRVNYCLQSEAFGTSPWSASNVTVTADQETAPDGATTADELEATSSNGTVTQPVTTTAIDMTFSVYLKRKTGTGNIDITADGTTWVTQTISDTAWTRCVVTQTAVAGTSNPGIRIVTSGDEVYAWGGQYE